MSDTKQVIVMRTDLKMRKGKMIAQGAHASIAFMTRRLPKIKLSKAEQEWMNTSFAKICVRVESEEQLLDIYQQAREVGLGGIEPPFPPYQSGAGLEVHLITDSGKTEFHGEPTRTCLAIGPDYSDKIDPITGDLKLL